MEISDSENHTNYSVSVIISVHNEEKVIEKRILNIANQDFDFSSFEVLVGSDNSLDRTNDILFELSKKYNWLKVFIFNERRGKAPVINDLVEKANNEILIFTDANTEFESNTIQKLTNGFKDNSIGGVSGRIVLRKHKMNESDNIEEKKYWEYETFIKKSEGKCGILIGANGGNYAIKRALFLILPIDKAITDDLFIPLAILLSGYKFTYCENALGYEEIAFDTFEEYKRKVRFASTNFQTISFFKNLLFNKQILLSYAIWSHKITRWFIPFLFIILFVLNCFLFNDSFLFQLILYSQILIYIFSFIGYILSKLKIRIRLFSIIYFFTILNIALINGFFKFIFKKHSSIWQPTSR